MPEPSSSKRLCKLPALRLDGVVGSCHYAELHCRTNFSFLEGASHADELAVRAAELGLGALAITDRNSLAGVVRAHVAAKEAKLKLLIGAEITLLDAAPVLLWASDRAAYGRLARLLTLGRRAAPKGECHIRFDDLAGHAAGLLAGVLLRPHSPPSGEGDIQRYRELFADRCYLVAELHRGPEDRRLLQRFESLSKKERVPLVAANDVHYHVSARRPLQDVLSAIRLGCTVAELGGRIFPNGERYLKSAAEMAELFADCPQAVARTLEVAGRCGFSLDELRYEYPEELCPAGTTPLRYLTELTWNGAAERYPAGIPAKVRALIEHELALIEELHYEAYFLTVWDLVRFARGRDILCQGRGSAANSAVCYCLGVTSVDPERIDVLFERFISKERNEAPDIDVDFEHERREEVIQYLYGKYGRERAGMTAEVITYRPRSAVRDVGKALGLSLDRVDVLAKSLGHHDSEAAKLAERLHEVGLDPQSLLAGQFLRLLGELLGFPRHLSQHVGGMVITQGPLCELVPIENAAMPDRTVVQWDKDDLDALGILKVDVLALGMLTAIRKCFDLIAAASPLQLSPSPPGTPGGEGRGEGGGKQMDAGDGSRRGPRRLRHGWPGRHDGGVSNREPGPDEHAATPQAALLLRSGDRGRDRSARPHPGGHGASVLAAPGRAGSGGISRRAHSRRAGKDAGGADLSGTGDAAGGGGGRLHPRRGRSAAPGHGRLAAPRRHGGLSAEVPRGHEGQRLPGNIRPERLSPDPGLRRLRFSRVARRLVRPLGLRLRLAQVLLPRRLRRRPAQQPADGFLRPRSAGCRRPQTRRGHPPGRCQLQPLGLHAGRRS